MQRLMHRALHRHPPSIFAMVISDVHFPAGPSEWGFKLVQHRTDAHCGAAHALSLQPHWHHTMTYASKAHHIAIVGNRLEDDYRGITSDGRISLMNGTRPHRAGQQSLLRPGFVQLSS
jgi:hypothetical protein